MSYKNKRCDCSIVLMIWKTIFKSKAYDPVQIWNSVIWKQKRLTDWNPNYIVCPKCEIYHTCPH